MRGKKKKERARERERWGNSRRFALTVANRERRLHTKADTGIPSPLGEDNTPMTKSNEHMIKSQVLEKGE